MDYLSLFLLLGAAPTWQAELDRLCSGLGIALLALLVLAGLRMVHTEFTVAPKKPTDSVPPKTGDASSLHAFKRAQST
jgi:hypothetical protein